MLVGRPGEVRRGPRHHIVNNDHAGSDRRYDAELAFDDDGTFRALRIDCVDDYGAYLQFGTGTHGNALSQIVGPYRIQHVEYSLAAVLTNKNQQGAYRGFGAEVSQLGARAARRHGRARARHRPRRDPPPQPDRGRTSSRTGRRPATSTTAATTRACSRRCSRRSTTTTGSPSATRRAPRAATSASASSPRRSGASSARPSSGSGSTSREFTPTSSPESASLQIDPTGQIVVTLHSQCALGQQPGDRRLAGRRRGVRRRSRVDRRHLRRLAARAAGHRARRLALHGDGLRRGRRRRRRAEGQDQAHRRPQARGEPRTTSSSATAASASSASPDRQLSLAEIALDRVHVPARPARRTCESGLAAQSTYDHPLTTLPERRPLRPRHLLPVRRPRLAHRRRRGRRRDGQARRSSATPPSTTPARSSTRRRSTARSSAARSRASARRCTRSTSTTTEGRVRNAELRVLPPALVDGRADDDGRAPGDAVARTRPTASRAPARAGGC